MYAVIARLTFKPGSLDTVKNIVREKLLPEMKSMPGFQHYYAIETGANSAASVTLWDSAAGLEPHLQLLAKRVTEEVGQYIESTEREHGEVAFEQSR